MVVSAKNVAAEYDDNAMKPDTVFVCKKVDNEFDHKFDVKEIGTRYSSKLSKKCPFNLNVI